MSTLCELCLLLLRTLSYFYLILEREEIEELWCWLEALALLWLWWLWLDNNNGDSNVNVVNWIFSKRRFKSSLISTVDSLVIFNESDLSCWWFFTETSPLRNAKSWDYVRVASTTKVFKVKQVSKWNPNSNQASTWIFLLLAMHPMILNYWHSTP